MEQDFSLKDFIAASLTEICEAVIEVRSKYTSVAPTEHRNALDPKYATNVEFDVAVTVASSNANSSDNGVKAGLSASIKVLKAEIGAGIKQHALDENSSSKISRIKFSIPVYLQFDKETVEKIKDENKKKARETASRLNSGGNSNWMG